MQIIIKYEYIICKKVFIANNISYNKKTDKKIILVKEILVQKFRQKFKQKFRQKSK